MSTTTKKVFATKSCEIDTQYSVGTTKAPILYTMIGSNYTETVYIGFDIDASTVKDGYTFNFYIANNKYSALGFANGYWTEDITISNMPTYTKGTYNCQLGWNSVQLTKDKLRNGFVIYRTENGGPTHVYSTRHEDNPPYIEYQETTPDLSNFVISGDSIDTDITASWTATDQQSYKLDILLNGIIQKSYTGTTATSVTVSQGTLNKNGDYTFNLTLSADETTTATTTKTLSWKQAKVIAIEPNAIAVNRDEQILISWSSENQTSFSLTVDGRTYTGTTDKSILIPKSTIQAGQISITLTIAYTGLYTNTDTKTVIFTAYGKPPTPVLTNKAIYSSSTPRLTWTSTEQAFYNISVYKGMQMVETSGDIAGTATAYTTHTTLENNTTYTIQLKIKNAYGLWSDVATSTFTTSFDVTNIPTCQVYADTTTASIVVTTSTVTSVNYKNSEVWRREAGGEWVRMAYNLALVDTFVDSYVKSDTVYEYKARSISLTGGIVESEPVSTSVKVTHYNFYDVEDQSKKVTLKYNATITSSLKRTVTSTKYAGTNAPLQETDGTSYKVLSMQFKTNNKDTLESLYSISSARLILLRDLLGNKLFGQIEGDIEVQKSDLGIYTVRFNFIEASFIEKDVYVGGNAGIKLYWDGDWYFDGPFYFTN